MTSFPNSVAAVVGEIIGNYYYHHATIETLFSECGAPGDPPEGSCVVKATAWLKRASADPETDGLKLLGGVLEVFMDTDAYRNFASPESHYQAKARVVRTLKNSGLQYVQGGRVIALSAGLSTGHLDDHLRARDLGGVNTEFERALATVEADPAAAVTAACAIVESLCKVYVEDEGLTMPADQSIQPLWRTVQSHLGLDPKSVEDGDLRQVLSGLASVTHGLGAFRTHVGSAHGRGRVSYQLRPRHARLVVNAAHTLVMFILDTWDARKTANRR